MHLVFLLRFVPGIVCRYLQWLGIEAKVFNVGNYRRKLFGTHQPHSFFDPTNPEGERSRNEATNAALKDMIHWFRKDEGTVALFDATNSTKAKRELLLQECERNGVEVMFIESVCEDEAIQLANAIETQMHSPDYEQMEPELALQDFKARTRLFKEKYETIVDRDQAYIKLIDAGSQVIVNRIKGYVQSRVVYYLMNLRIAPRNIYFSRVSANICCSCCDITCMSLGLYLWCISFSVKGDSERQTETKKKKEY